VGFPAKFSQFALPDYCIVLIISLNARSWSCHNNTAVTALIAVLSISSFTAVSTSSYVTFRPSILREQKMQKNIAVVQYA